MKTENLETAVPVGLPGGEQTGPVAAVSTREALIRRTRLDYTASPLALSLMQQAADMLETDDKEVPQEPVMWQYRWTNPTGDNQPQSMMEWKPVEPRWNGTVLEKVQELETYRYGGKPTYEVRALVVAPQPQRPPLTDYELTDMWLDAKRYANPTAADAHLRFARAVEKKVRGEA